jgi:hypothetical protein
MFDWAPLHGNEDDYERWIKTLYCDSAFSDQEDVEGPHVAELTEINNKMASMTTKPRSDNTLNAEITYRICNSSVKPFCKCKRRTYPNAAIDKTRFD